MRGTESHAAAGVAAATWLRLAFWLDATGCILSVATCMLLNRELMEATSYERRGWVFYTTHISDSGRQITGSRRLNEMQQKKYPR